MSQRDREGPPSVASPSLPALPPTPAPACPPRSAPAPSPLATLDKPASSDADAPNNAATNAPNKPPNAAPFAAPPTPDRSTSSPASPSTTSPLSTAADNANSNASANATATHPDPTLYIRPRAPTPPELLSWVCALACLGASPLPSLRDLSPRLRGEKFCCEWVRMGAELGLALHARSAPADHITPRLRRPLELNC